MSVVASAPAGAEFFLDLRGEARTLRVRRHPEAGLVLLSIWHDDACVASFRLPEEEVPALLHALAGAQDGRDDTPLQLASTI